MSEATSVLERSALPRPEGTDLAELWGDLPEEAADKLGYQLLQDKKQRYQLWSVLSDLGIRPFTAESVERYKALMAEEARPKRPLRDRLLSLVQGLTIFAVLVSLGPMLLGWIISWKISVVFLGILIGSLVVSFSINGTTVKSEPEWKTVPLDGYSEPVPEFALKMAVDINSRLPGATTSVCQLVQSERVLDPFLIVEHGPERHYIAVWNEPAFGAIPLPPSTAEAAFSSSPDPQGGP